MGTGRLCGSRRRRLEFHLAAIGGINYAISPTTIAKFGYRYLKVDYRRDDFLYNMGTGGFYAGIGMRF